MRQASHEERVETIKVLINEQITGDLLALQTARDFHAYEETEAITKAMEIIPSSSVQGAAGKHLPRLVPDGVAGTFGALSVGTSVVLERRAWPQRTHHCQRLCLAMPSAKGRWHLLKWSSWGSPWAT